MRTTAVLRYALPLSLALSACSPPDESDDIGVAVLSLVQVPADVRCVRITAAGARTVVKSFDVMPGAGAVFSLNRLPLGAVAFSGEAFAAACASVGPASVPEWVADAVTVTISAGVEAAVSLTMRRNGRASVSVDFVDDPATCPMGKLCFVAMLTGFNEVPPVMTAATGTAGVIFDPATLQITLRLQHNIPDATAAHIHGPAAPGVNAGVMVGITPPSMDITIMAMLTPPQAMALQAGLTYVNVHSPANPGGQIRGQLLAAP
jgi:hypothetical protein